MDFSPLRFSETRVEIYERKELGVAVISRFRHRQINLSQENWDFNKNNTKMAEMYQT